MILVKDRLLFGAIKKFVVGVMKAVYKIISFINLQGPLLVLLFGAVLFLTGAFETNATVLVLFYAALVISILISVLITVRKVFKFDRVNRKNNMQIINEKSGETPINAGSPPREEKTFPSPSAREGYPRYFSVRQNQNYIMAEYEDRYILYYRTENGFKKVRTDYK